MDIYLTLIDLKARVEKLEAAALPTVLEPLPEPAESAPEPTPEPNAHPEGEEA